MRGNSVLLCPPALGVCPQQCSLPAEPLAATGSVGPVRKSHRTSPAGDLHPRGHQGVHHLPAGVGPRHSTVRSSRVRKGPNGFASGAKRAVGLCVRAAETVWKTRWTTRASSNSSWTSCPPSGGANMKRPALCWCSCSTRRLSPTRNCCSPPTRTPWTSPCRRVGAACRRRLG